ncbi:MAG: O-antigen ligase family protein [Oscillospiraceae bacterium]|nr:O-antigen ligase family protein [Oscillospiraceae bacterium]
MKIKINDSFFIKINFFMMGMVTILYSLYIINKPDSLYSGLQLCRFILLVTLICGLLFCKISIDRNTVIPLMFLVYVFVRSCVDNGDLFNKMLTILIWPLIYLLFYSYTRRNSSRDDFTVDGLKKILVFFLIIQFAISIQLIAIHLSGNGRAGEVIFPVYFVLTIYSVALLLFPNNRIIMVLTCAMVLFSTKRVGILTLACGIVAVQFTKLHLAGTLKAKWRRFLAIIFLLVVLVAAILFLTNYLGIDIIQRFSDLSDDSGSGRSLMWASLIADFRSGTSLQQLFGKGFQAVTNLMLTGRTVLAHNDYLEILYDYGIVGLVLIIMWVLQLLGNMISAWRRKSLLLPSYTYTVIGIVFFSMFSYLMIQSYLMMFTACYLGIANAILSNKTA